MESQLQTDIMNADPILFFISALVAIFGAIMMIAQKISRPRPVSHSVVAGRRSSYVQLGALFSAQFCDVYAGAIRFCFCLSSCYLTREAADLGFTASDESTSQVCFDTAFGRRADHDS